MVEIERVLDALGLPAPKPSTNPKPKTQDGPPWIPTASNERPPF